MNPFQAVRKHLKTRGLLLALALISIIGFSLNSLSIYFGQTLLEFLAYPSIILGVGLIYESRAIDKFVFNDWKQVFDLPKFITLLVGVVVLVGGIVSSLGFSLSPQIMGIILWGNVIAIGVIVYEIFLIE